jgi:hypothetical protein
MICGDSGRVHPLLQDKRGSAPDLDDNYLAVIIVILYLSRIPMSPTSFALYTATNSYI